MVPRMMGTLIGIILSGRVFIAVAVRLSVVISEAISFCFNSFIDGTGFCFFGLVIGMLTVIFGFFGVTVSSREIAVQACPVFTLNKSPWGQNTGSVNV